MLIKYLQDTKSSKDQSKKNVDLMASMNTINMGDTVMSFFLNISSKTDISPKGFIAML